MLTGEGEILNTGGTNFSTNPGVLHIDDSRVGVIGYTGNIVQQCDSGPADAELVRAALADLEREDERFRKRMKEIEEEIKKVKETRSDDLTKARLRGMGLKPTDDPDVNYFLANMHNALRVPEGYLNKKIDKLSVGPNDVLVIHVDATDIPSSAKEKWLRKVKKSVGPLFDARGLKDRHIWVAADKTGFSVIGIEKTLTKKDVDEARRILREKKPRPPIMG